MPKWTFPVPAFADALRIQPHAVEALAGYCLFAVGALPVQDSDKQVVESAAFFNASRRYCWFDAP
jgi:hypothetical protein